MNDQRKESELKMSEVSRRLQECQSKSQQLVRSLHEASTNLAIARDLNSHYEKRYEFIFIDTMETNNYKMLERW